MELINYFNILALLVAASAGLVGSFALMKRMTLAGDVISHVALPGLGLAFLYKINPLIGGAATLLIGTLIIWRLGENKDLTIDSAIGVIFASSLALGTLLTPAQDLVDALFGGFKTPNTTEFIVGLILALLIALFILVFRDKLIISLFSPDLAEASGISVSRINLYFLLIFSLTVLLGLQFLGALLVGALIIIPAAVGRQLTHTLPWFLIMSVVASVLSVLAGILIHARWENYALGPTIVLSSTVLFLLSLLKKKD